MTTLNRAAAAVIARHSGVHAVTDVTGFGLMGHGREMAMASGVAMEIDTWQVPQLEGALEAIALGTVPAGLLANREFAECIARDDGKVDESVRLLMYDPQTSGGLLVSVEQRHADTLLHALHETGAPAQQVGRVMAGKPGILLRGSSL
jgi:selenide,water dikinase